MKQVQHRERELPVNNRAEGSDGERWVRFGRQLGATEKQIRKARREAYLKGFREGRSSGRSAD